MGCSISVAVDLYSWGKVGAVVLETSASAELAQLRTPLLGVVGWPRAPALTRMGLCHSYEAQLTTGTLTSPR
jgi:hypothetical protein